MRTVRAVKTDPPENIKNFSFLSVPKIAAVAYHTMRFLQVMGRTWEVQPGRGIDVAFKLKDFVKVQFSKSIFHLTQQCFRRQFGHSSTHFLTLRRSWLVVAAILVCCPRMLDNVRLASRCSNRCHHSRHLRKLKKPKWQKRERKPSLCKLLLRLNKLELSMRLLSKAADPNTLIRSTSTSIKIIKRVWQTR